ncbi:MAG TPA: haloacid dehalogenase, partial [Acidimicrobiaceae bacterium]|nr:haloacid dehalogenase [Acidimicrobiaceae bacterium]
MNLVAEQSSSSAQVPDGLSTAEAVELLRQNGENRLPPPVRVPAWRRLLSEMVHFFALMLWVAGGLAFVAGMPQLGVAIFIVVLVNGLFAFAQAQRAEHAAEQLRELLPIGVLVRRDGHKQTIDATQLVLGDLVILAAGDRVAADLSVLEANGLS